ncbi:hypothetical protein [Paenibacillus durus]|uniref:Uncharacterized protein n=1 Tax=Paenibacillus durus ATCC 35681 TaxID=1333534 RepID=A0A0F7FCF2_PAEDU|nr:hypothetical protein [Paenibacillus durus]AKG36065.1 hypothetical protein VK70_17125 [Paenibacillus durus ATCC 35681]
MAEMSMGERFVINRGLTMGKKRIDLTGKRFGRLVVEKRSEKTIPSSPYKAFWDCICDCGTRKAVEGYWLTSGNTQSCGCLKKDQHINGSKATMLKISPRKDNKTGHTGVIKNKNGTYTAMLVFQGKAIYNGLAHTTFESAVRAREELELKYFQPVIDEYAEITAEDRKKASHQQFKVCRTPECGEVFIGGPRAFYCPGCREQRKRQQSADYQRRKRKGDVREIGSIDTCERCGKQYVVNSGLQQVCEECRPLHTSEYDRSTGIEHYRANKDRINPARNVKRRKRSDKCVVCGKKFDPVNGSTTCSGECKRKLMNQHYKDWYKRQKWKVPAEVEKFDMSDIAREIGKHKSTVRNHYLAGKLPEPDGQYPSGRNFWYRKSLANYINDAKEGGCK